eukprot:CAMPEP_0177663744 /NCGR_PEP_ID=MMETSP0447-20121125/20090_1 /TAXON_ID=0 /ORGANISM="Stygamoeba regulata, Strain BSH-02190019" /LENGTH=200 /DNA_ID=CAMNT_0019169603 /DNA_START=54 /DNA_END=656 /DNA_ORIENTATION=-
MAGIAKDSEIEELESVFPHIPKKKIVECLKGLKEGEDDRITQATNILLATDNGKDAKGKGAKVESEDSGASGEGEEGGDDDDDDDDDELDDELDDEDEDEEPEEDDPEDAGWVLMKLMEDFIDVDPIFIKSTVEAEAEKESDKESLYDRAKKIVVSKSQEAPQAKSDVTGKRKSRQVAETMIKQVAEKESQENSSKKKKV